MKRGYIACGALSACVLAGIVNLSVPSLVPEAHAEEAAPAANVTSPSCLIKGVFPPPKNLSLYDAASGGNVIGTLTGAVLPLTLSEIPFDLTSGRAKLRTSTGSGALRIEGYLPASDVPLFTSRDISLVGGSVWISSAQKVKLVSAQADSLRVEVLIAGTNGQTARTVAPCDAFSLAKGTPTALEIPDKARGFMMKGSTIDLYDKPGGEVVFSLNMIEGTGHLFWSTESRAGFVHVMTRTDVTIDAWARFRDLEPLKKGEMVDQYIPPTTKVDGAKFEFDKPPKLMRATREVLVRAKRDEKAKPIGALEADAEVYVMETVAGWTNILPKHLGLTAPDDGGFWIPNADVPSLITP